MRETAERGVGGLFLVLNGGERLLHAGHASLELVDGVVEGLDLAGDLLVAGADGILLVLHAELQAIDRGGHGVDGVGGLLDELLEHAEALVVGLLQFRDGVLQRLDLGL